MPTPSLLQIITNSAQVKTAPWKFAGGKDPLYNVDNQVPLIPKRIKQLNILYPYAKAAQFLERKMFEKLNMMSFKRTS